ncbi:hypothetical protein TSYNTROOL_19720 [Tepidanaerobacter syntrophicus]|nr:hypothetical protein [Tepidanaerobacter syntrophicus]GLI51886.1 hypothetical protein TSYNTROOL_19720 [Tepidanaerobacter syntrophicus]
MSNDYPDIYFLPDYGKLYESHEKGKLKTFTINDECGKKDYI